MSAPPAPPVPPPPPPPLPPANPPAVGKLRRSSMSRRGIGEGSGEYRKGRSALTIPVSGIGSKSSGMGY